MTREEAVKALIDMANVLCLDPNTPQGIAFKMAIKALSQQTEDAISRQTVLDLMQLRMGGKELYMAVYELPSVNPQPKTGHWIYICNSEVNGLKIVKCSECSKRTYGSGKYCPNCGTKMIEPQESEVHDDDQKRAV